MKEESFAYALFMNIKSIRLLIAKYPKVFGFYGVNSLFKALKPYIYLYLSARLINELVILNMSMIWKLVALTLVINGILEMLGNKINHMERYHNSLFMSNKETLFSDKLMSLKYMDLDSSTTYDLLAQIHMNEQYAGYGLTKSIDIFKKTLSIFASIAGSSILCITLFWKKMVDYLQKALIYGHTRRISS